MDHVEFGKYLSQQRELRGLSRDDVARETKIPPTLIAALEAGQVERLQPGGPAMDLPRVTARAGEEDGDGHADP